METERRIQRRIEEEPLKRYSSFEDRGRDRSRRYATKIRQWVLELPRNATVKPSNELLREQ